LAENFWYDPAKIQHDPARFAWTGGIVLRNGGNLPAAMAAAW
jgi:hypothetical protein